MKYLHYFEDTTSFENEYDGENYIQPWVSYNKQQEDVDYDAFSQEQISLMSMPLTLEILEAGHLGVKFNNPEPYSVLSGSYRINGGEWKSYSASYYASGFSVNTGDVVEFTGWPNVWYNDTYYYSYFWSDCKFNVKGNIMSLLGRESSTFTWLGIDGSFMWTIMNNPNFSCLFKDSNVVDASKLILPRYKKCVNFESMFKNCTSLIAAPSLPATTLNNSCYKSMFEGCVSLTIAPELPATTLSDYCYMDMFKNCTSLLTAPELPAINLPTNGPYKEMFYNCNNINLIKAYFTNWEYGDQAQNWLYGTSSTGTFIKNSNATWPEASVIPSGWTVETITV